MEYSWWVASVSVLLPYWRKMLSLDRTKIQFSQIAVQKFTELLERSIRNFQKSIVVEIIV